MTDAPESQLIEPPPAEPIAAQPVYRGVFGVLRRMKDWMFKYSERPNALWWLAGFSFAESSFFPIPPDVLLIPIGAANPKRALFAGMVCTAASALGALLGYFFGYLIFTNLGANGGEVFISDLFGSDAVTTIKRLNIEYGLWMVFIAGLTPIPFKLMTIWSGFWYQQYDLLPFFGICVLARGARFMTVSLLMRLFGKKIQYELEKRFNFWSIAFMILLIGGFLLMKLLK
ncbi:MAG: DedA family protein [Planctomycetota bacterium]